VAVSFLALAAADRQAAALASREDRQAADRQASFRRVAASCELQPCRLPQAPVASCELQASSGSSGFLDGSEPWWTKSRNTKGIAARGAAPPPGSGRVRECGLRGWGGEWRELG